MGKVISGSSPEGKAIIGKRKRLKCRLILFLIVIVFFIFLLNILGLWCF